MKSSAGPGAERENPTGPDPAALIGSLSGSSGLIVAVSGGPDSTALMLLLATWRERPPALVVSVDHRLRPESAREARQAARNARRLGFPARVMPLRTRFSGGNIQSWAREARYTALVEAAREAGYDTIVTAHHQEDQAETFLMRLARGSGPHGLGAMRELSHRDGVRIVRPLLSTPRSVLHRLAEASGLALAQDPGNSDLRYDRVRMRRALADLGAAGLTPRTLAQAARQIARTSEALDLCVDRLILAQVEVDGSGGARVGVDAVLGANEELALRALSRMVQSVGGGQYAPATKRLASLLNALQIAASGEGAPLKRTLGGAEVSLRAGTLLVRREWGRSGIPAVPVRAGRSLRWDRRFFVRVEENAGPGLSIAPLGTSERLLVSAEARSSALRALPGLFRAGVLLAVPPSVSPRDRGEALQHLCVRCLVGERLRGAPVPLV